MAFRVLHFATDSKFISSAMSLYEEAFPGQNQFRVIRNIEGRYVAPSESVRFVETSSCGSESVRKDLKECECLVVHAMTPEFVSGVQCAPRSVLVVWYGWGFEYCWLVEREIGPIILPKTQQLKNMLRIRMWLKKLLSPLELARSLVGQVRMHQGFPGRVAAEPAADLRAVAGRLDVFSVNPAEAPRIRRALPELRAAHEMLSYFTTEDTLETGPVIMSGPDILLGNSAAMANNHLEILSQLKGCDLQGRRLITPLSYGAPDYADYVSKVGEKYFGSSFIPLREFLTLEEYNQRIQSCGTVIMNHVRQQAVGNISSSLYKKAKVVLRPNSALYQFFEDLGVTVFRVDDLRAVLNSEIALDPDAAERNREIMGRYWARARALESLRRLKTYHPRRTV